MIKALNLVIMFSVSNDGELPMTCLTVLRYRCRLERAAGAPTLYCSVDLMGYIITWESKQINSNMMKSLYLYQELCLQAKVPSG